MDAPIFFLRIKWISYNDNNIIGGLVMRKLYKGLGLGLVMGIALGVKLGLSGLLGILFVIATIRLAFGIGQNRTRRW